jgi:hypothetical protein
MAFTYVTVTHTFETAAGVAAGGTVDFTPIVSMHNGGTVVQKTVTATLSGAGVLSQMLAANTDPETRPTGTTYKVVERIQGQPTLTYYIQIPHNGGTTIDLRDLAGWQGGTGSSSGVTTINGELPNPAGNVVVSASDVGAQPVSDLLTRFSAPPITLAAVGGVITPNAASGDVFRHTADANVQLADPTGGIDGQTVAVEVLATGADRTLTFAGGAAAVTIAVGLKWAGVLRYDTARTEWVLDDSTGGGAGGGGGAGVSSVTAADATIAIGGTGSSPTVAVGDVPQAKVTNLVTDLAGKAAATHSHAGGDITSGTVTPARLGSGTPSSATFLRGDGSWQSPASSGYATLQDEGSPRTTRTVMNFMGRAVTAVDDGANSRTNVTVADVPTVHAVGNSGAALTVDAASTSGYIKTVTLTANCTFTFTGAAVGDATMLELVLTQDATGGRTATWPATVKWGGGVVPSLSSTAAAVDRLVFVSYNGGTTWFGDLVGRAYA